LYDLHAEFETDLEFVLFVQFRCAHYHHPAVPGCRVDCYPYIPNITKSSAKSEWAAGFVFGSGIELEAEYIILHRISNIKTQGCTDFYAISMTEEDISF